MTNLYLGPAKRRLSNKKEGCCPDCGAEVGQAHIGGCGIERCPQCGMQRMSCGCITDLSDLPWTGEFPGRAEAAQLGLWCKWTRAGWRTCEATDADALPDLNRLYKEYQWNPSLRQWEAR